MFMRAVHPGRVLKDELDELGITPTEFSRQIDVPPNRVSQIIAGKRSITGDTALRFGHWFGTDPQFWLNLQAQFDLLQADKETGEMIRHLPTARVGLPKLNARRPCDRALKRVHGIRSSVPRASGHPRGGPAGFLLIVDRVARGQGRRWR